MAIFPTTEAQQNYGGQYQSAAHDPLNFKPETWDKFIPNSAAWWSNRGRWDGYYLLPPVDPTLQAFYQNELQNVKRNIRQAPPPPPGPPPGPQSPSAAPLAPIPVTGTDQPAPPPRANPAPATVDPNAAPPVVAPALQQYQDAQGRIYVLPPGSSPPAGFTPVPAAPWSNSPPTPYNPAPPWYGSQPSPYPPAAPWQQGTGISFWGPWGNITLGNGSTGQTGSSPYPAPRPYPYPYPYPYSGAPSYPYPYSSPAPSPYPYQNGQPSYPYPYPYPYPYTAPLF